MRSTQTLWLLVVLGLGFAIALGAKAQTLTPEARKSLLQKAEHWSVPQPHPRSNLLKIFVFRSSSSDFYVLGFVEPGNPDRALVGFDYWAIAQRAGSQVVSEPDGLSLDDISPTSPFDGPYGVNFGIITGIQLLERGNEQLGLALINKALGESAGHHGAPIWSPAREAPVLMLAHSCLASALNEITSAKPDFPKIKRRVERLLADQPKLKNKATDWVLESLEASVAHPPAPAGTIDRLIDDYLLGGGKEGASVLRTGSFTPAEQALILKGFEAVSALLKQRHSMRFSNHVMQGFNNFPSYPMTAGGVINAYLQRLANHQLGLSWLHRQQGHVAADEAVLAWWKQASAIGEEAYVQKHAVILDEDGRPRLSHELLLLARERYPAHLPGFYRTLLQFSLSSEPVAEAILLSEALPRERKVELFLAGVATNHPAHRNVAIGHLQDLNPALADEHLRRLLENAPTTPKGEYWKDQDANLGGLVSRSSAPEVWQALHALLERADLGMRMELIHHLLPPHDARADTLDSFHRVYVHFRDDKAIRDESTSEKFSGPGAGFPHRQIAMRDFIHQHWSGWLKLGLKPLEPGATPNEWKAFRTAVSLAIQRDRAGRGAESDKSR